MEANDKPTPFLYVDDGYPESREYADNYIALDPQEPRGWIRILLGGRRARASRTASIPGMIRAWMGRRSIDCATSIRTSH
jgi:hypothetical protein